MRCPPEKQKRFGLYVLFLPNPFEGRSLQNCLTLGPFHYHHINGELVVAKWCTMIFRTIVFIMRGGRLTNAVTKNVCGERNLTGARGVNLLV